MRGLEAHQEHHPQQLLRDTRPFFDRCVDVWAAPLTAVGLYGAGVLWVLAAPPEFANSDLVLVLSLLYALFFYVHGQKKKLPMRTPLNRLTDHGEEDGIFFLGNDQKSNHEIWLSTRDLKTHIFEVGTTGSGKTSALRAKLVNALAWGSGAVYVDGKADTTLWAEVYALAKTFGREDDLLVLNFLTAASDRAATSNTLNPFAFDSSSGISELITNLLSDSGVDSMWKDRAISLVKAVIPALTWKRDHEGLLLDVGTIRHALTLPEVIKLSRDASLHPKIREGLKAYLDALPGYSAEQFDDKGQEISALMDPKPQNTQTCREQHNYLTMQLTASLGALADSYGHIFKASLADIDMRDVVLNRRILLVLLPTLEKSAMEVANLGKIVVSNLKAMMASALGSTLDGSMEEVLGNKMGHAPSPFLCFFDEVGHYTTPGMGAMAAQARSLGFGMIFATQDLPSMRKRIKEEADTIIANCNTKIFLKLEDALETRTLFEKTVGEAHVTQVSGFSNTSHITSTYHDRLDASVERRLRADYLDLKAQTEGKAHILIGDKLLRAQLFYAPIDLPPMFRVHKFLKLEEDASDNVGYSGASQETVPPLPDEPEGKTSDFLQKGVVLKHLFKMEELFGFENETIAQATRDQIEALFSILQSPFEPPSNPLSQEEVFQTILTCLANLKTTIGDEA